MPAPGVKVRVPAPRRRLVPRARLDNPFRAVATSWPRLVLISAAAGFGKTTLLTQWLTTGRDDRGPRVAWASLDEADADVRQFLRTLVASLEETGDGLGTEARAFLQNDRGAPVEAVLVSLVNDLDRAAGPTIIALDDYHRAGDPAIHEALAFLLDNLPPQVSVAVTTRADPPLPLARMRSRGELLEIRAAELRFDHDESDEFLRDVMDLALPPEHVGALETRTEGWVAGLQLAALSARSRTSSGTADAVDAFVHEFSGSHRFVLDYLVEEVLGGQPEEVRRFLLVTSVLEALTGPLCDALTGLTDGRRTLELLERGNVFVVPLDDRRQWYRYHHLFADALRARLMSTDPERVPLLHRAASRWYVAEGLLDEAVHHASRGRDVDWSAALVELARPGLRKQRRDSTIIEWLGLLPEPAIRARPLLSVARAWSRLAVGDPVGAAGWLDTAEVGLEAPPAEPDWRVPEPLARARDDEIRTVPSTIAIYRAALAQARGDVLSTIENARRAEDLAADSDHLVHGAAAGFIGLAAWAAGDLRSAADTFRSVIGHLAAAGDVVDQLGATVVLANIAMGLGRPAEARGLYEGALRAAEQDPAAGLGIAGDLHVGIAEVLREQGDLDGGIHHLRIASELGPPSSLPENRFRWNVARAGILFTCGDLDGAIEQLDRAEAAYLPGFFPDVRPIAAVRARVRIAGGRLAEARDWERRVELDTSGPVRYLSEYDVLTLARLELAELRAASLPRGRAEAGGVLGLLDRLVDAALEAGRPGSLVEALMVRALAQHVAGNQTQAQADLATALTEGVPAGYRRLFLDEGQPMEDLLAAFRRARPPGPATALAEELLASARRPLPTPDSDGVSALSERELEVMRLLATDLTGPEIAGHLFVTVNTLRTHTKHIFTKLDVRTRRAAVARARELQLL